MTSFLKARDGRRAAVQLPATQSLMNRQHWPRPGARSSTPPLSPGPERDGSSSRVRGATQSPPWPLEQAEARQRARAAALLAGALRPAAEAVEEVQRCDSGVVAHLPVLCMHI